METDSLGAATLWVQGMLLGTVGTTIAVLAVAVAGLGMLRGHLSARDGARIVLGCFILFGAPLIARGLIGVPGSAASSEIIVVPQAAVAPPVRASPPASSINPFDPYIGVKSRN